MNYYIEGNAAKADQIKAAFEAKGFIPRIAPMYYGSESVLFFTGIDNYIYETSNPWVMDIIKTHPDYKELELPVVFKNGDIIGFNDCTHNDGSYVDWVGIYKRKSDDFRDQNQHLFHCVVPSIGTFRTGGLWRVFTAYPATKEQRDLLFAKMKEAVYEWDEKKKELCKIIDSKFKVGDEIKTGSTIETIAEIDYATRSYCCESGRTIWFENQDLWKLAPKPHYDISNFHTGMPVLVRDGDSDDDWTYALFSHYNSTRTSYKFSASGDVFRQCIPFEGNEKLLGTTDMPSEEYINW